MTVLHMAAVRYASPLAACCCTAPCSNLCQSISPASISPSQRISCLQCNRQHLSNSFLLPGLCVSSHTLALCLWQCFPQTLVFVSNTRCCALLFPSLCLPHGIHCPSTPALCPPCRVALVPCCLPCHVAVPSCHLLLQLAALNTALCRCSMMGCSRRRRRQWQPSWLLPQAWAVKTSTLQVCCSTSVRIHCEEVALEMLSGMNMAAAPAWLHTHWLQVSDQITREFGKTIRKTASYSSSGPTTRLRHG